MYYNCYLYIMNTIVWKGTPPGTPPMYHGPIMGQMKAQGSKLDEISTCPVGQLAKKSTSPSQRYCSS